jgi:hypothetical protein
MLTELGIVNLPEKLRHMFNCHFRRSHKFICISNQPLPFFSNSSSLYKELIHNTQLPSKFTVACVGKVAGSSLLTQVFRYFSQSSKASTEIVP